MRVVASAYSFLKDKGFLSHFSKFRSIVLDGTRDVTPTVLKSSTGLDGTLLLLKADSPVLPLTGVTGVCFRTNVICCSVLDGTRDVTPIVLNLQLAYKFPNFHQRNGVFLERNSSLVLLAFFAGLSYLVDHGIDLRPHLAVTLGLAMVDSVFLGGSCLAQISSYWPLYKRRILVHEAGHLLVAYLMGCPVRGVILDPIVAMQMGIQGQAGTQFWDENLQNELAEGRLTGVAFVRYCMVLFGGIAAEALVYGEAEDGENDENLFRSICLLLEPPLTVAQMSNQARWSVLQSYNLLKWHKHAHQAAVRALESGDSLSVVIRSIEEAMATSR